MWAVVKSGARERRAEHEVNPMRRLSLAGWLAAAGFLVALPPGGGAAVLPVPAGDVPALVAAITTANGDTNDTISLAAGATYTLVAPDNGINGLPIVTSKMSVQGNGATVTRGGAPAFRIFEVGAGGDLTLDHLTVSGGDAPGLTVEGGGILVFGAGAKLTLTNVTVTGNTSAFVGGGVALMAASQALTMTSSHVDGNHALTGGGVYVQGNNNVLDIRDSTINGNVMNNPSGGVEGGGIAFENTGTFTLTDSTVDGNTGTAGAGNSDGAGIALESIAVVTISGSTISNNALTATAGHGVGGGIADEGGATVLIENTTLSGNMVSGASATNAGGGIISEGGGGTTTLDNVTITNNSANRGGGLAARTGALLRFMNTIIAGNPAPADSPDCFIDAATALTSLGHNLVQSTTGCAFTAASGDIVGMSAGLGALQANGGATETHALLAGSPAIDKGDPAAPGSGGTACEATDQRGVVRPQGPACDIGAFEGTVTTTTLPPSGCERAPTFPSIDCRLDVLIGAIGQAQNLKKLQAPLLKGVMRAKKQKEDAERLVGQRRVRPAKSALKHAIRSMISVGFRLRSLTARKTIQPPSTRTGLLDMATPIQQDMKMLLKSLPKR